jgi:hypothetical protein
LVIVVESLVEVKSPVSSEGRTSRVVPCPFGVWIAVVNETREVPPLRVFPVKPPPAIQVPDSQTVPVKQSESVVQAPPVQTPVVEEQVNPEGHWELLVQVAGTKIAGVATHLAEVPVALKLPLLSASASDVQAITRNDNTRVFFKGLAS